MRKYFLLGLFLIATSVEASQCKLISEETEDFNINGGYGMPRIVCVYRCKSGVTKVKHGTGYSCMQTVYDYN